VHTFKNAAEAFWVEQKFGAFIVWREERRLVFNFMNPEA
jgi:hypothetical protein